MAARVVKALMQILAAGSNSRPRRHGVYGGKQPAPRMRVTANHRVPAATAVRGFTLLELMVVMAIVAVVAVVAVGALPSSSQQQLEYEAQQLVSRLEVARAHARATGQRVQARIDADGIDIQTAGHTAHERHAWRFAGHHADPVLVQLGPEPIIAPQSVVLRTPQGRSLRIATQGVAPFAVEAQP